MPTPEYCLLAINWWPLCMTKAEWSGWMQAIGAVVAIFASAAYVRWQHALELKRQLHSDRESRKRQHSAFVALARTTVTHARWLRERLPDREAFIEIARKRSYFDMEDVARLARPLESIPLHEIDDPTMLLEIILLVEHCRSIRTLLSTALSEARGLDAKTFNDLFAEFDRELGNLTMHLDALSERAGRLAGDSHVAALP